VALVTRHAKAAASAGSAERLGVAAVGAAAVVSWLCAFAGLVGTIAALADLTWADTGWADAVWVTALCVAPSSALYATRRTFAARRVRALVPRGVLGQRYHGSLDALACDDQRSLRPVAATAYEVAARTGDLLAELIAIPGVRIFRGVHPAGASHALIPHAVSAGRQIVFVESVAWPPGHYEIAPDGSVLCDGTYIGQSVRPLLAAVRHWRGSLARHHQVSATIVVHGAGDGDLTLAATTPDGMTWVRAEDAITAIRHRILRSRRSPGRDVIAKLITATDDQG
jgi:hypothetical protein